MINPNQLSDIKQFFFVKDSKFNKEKFYWDKINQIIQDNKYSYIYKVNKGYVLLNESILESDDILDLLNFIAEHKIYGDDLSSEHNNYYDDHWVLEPINNSADIYKIKFHALNKSQANLDRLTNNINQFAIVYFDKETKDFQKTLSDVMKAIKKMQSQGFLFVENIDEGRVILSKEKLFFFDTNIIKYYLIHKNDSVDGWRVKRLTEPLTECQINIYEKIISK